MTTLGFVDPAVIIDGGPHAFRRAVRRLLLHVGFDSVSDTDGSGDRGADLVAFRGQEIWVIQSKWKLNETVSHHAVTEVRMAWSEYGAHYGLLVTNGRLSKQAKAALELANQQGARLLAWDGATLTGLYTKKATEWLPAKGLRQYQSQALEAVSHGITTHKAALLYMATGLGKTTVAGSYIKTYIERADEFQGILVLAHTNELIYQLEVALWPYIHKSVPTLIVNGLERPSELRGVVFATRQSILHYLSSGYRPGLVFIDEAHHVGASGEYAEILSLLPHAHKLAVTATPWRGDGHSIKNQFGDPVASISIEDGMRLGYLTEVDYRVFCDNIDWDFVQARSKNSYSVRELNKKLFIPSRDKAIIDNLLSVCSDIRSPKVLIFCQSVLHADYIAETLAKIPEWAATKSIHSQIAKWERTKRLIAFKTGATKILTCVDILNEGVDVPDVNVVCFLRVTHSRRIFIQQLGRGLRISEGKDKVVVLDYVSDIRRIAAIIELSESTKGNNEVLDLPRNSFKFEDKSAESLLKSWITDAASLETSDDETRLNFPIESG